LHLGGPAQNHPLFTCRGNGFITDTNIIKKYGLSDANDFFRQLVSKPYVRKVRPLTLWPAVPEA
jgi:hypothetical protein